ncbi:PREDICTED: protein FAM184A-like [Amphimedon queenslandica]|uniref:Uncharacterized protein n=1 Tax=Amphimedon queenslandica TaxID=400682 RepID=A0AAN0J8W3_AMPQE|nr:PREDICTED: protein FAM184A-like [Amphimedon queenslandica]|eukprot:XP_019853148.1 PREDICTED: protein FAM184A-like [Amphimedon queenslandica]
MRGRIELNQLIMEGDLHLEDAAMHNKRMCKKIADLIKVIDKLFREFYEQGILYQALKDKEEFKSAEKKKAEVVATSLKLENERLQGRVEGLERELESLKNSKIDNEREIQELQDRLKAVMEEMTLNETNMDKEINHLKRRLEESLTAANSKECTSCSEYSVKINELQKETKNHLDKIEEIKKDNTVLKSSKIKLEEKLTNTSDEIKALKEEATTRVSLLNTYEMDNEELRTNVHELRVKLKHVQSTKSKAASQSSDRLYSRQRKEREYWLETPQYKGKEGSSSEIEYLKQEIQKYKMELINRETNFNKVFTSTSLPLRSKHHQSPSLPFPSHEGEARIGRASLKGSGDVQLPKLSSHRLGKSLI